ncbi:MAG: tetratricopeptide repeat protein [Anaerolineales bacterium]|nr:tetratricopeptide repeat protein [Chloroflexota bacterium]MBL6982159.1 tetratricopeptide repeat protein [Anaerolineales bacterium]
MRKLWDEGIIQRIVGLFVLITLLGISPRPHAVRRGFELARLAQSDNSLRAAEQLALLAEQLPWRDDLWEQAGHSAMNAGAYAESIEYFEKAQTANQLSVSGHLALGDAFLSSEDLDSAVRTWETLKQEYSPSEESLARLADAYLKKDDYDKTILVLKELIEFNVSNLQTLTSNVQTFDFPFGDQGKSPISNISYTLGILLAAHQPESAPPYLLQAAEQDIETETLARELVFVIQRALPKDEPAYTLLVSGQKLAQHNQWRYAAHAFQQATELRPDYAEAWAYLGEAYQQLDNSSPEIGLAELEWALILDPNSLAANTFMALYWQRAGDHQQSQVYLQKAADLDPYNATLLIHLGEMWAQSGDLVTAQRFHEEAIELDPYDPISYQALVEFCIRYNVELHTLALPAARQALTLEPYNPAALDVMGQVLFRLGDYVNAERFYLQALANNHEHHPTHLHLGLLYILQDQLELARLHLTLAITLAPNSATADHAQRLLRENLLP